MKDGTTLIDELKDRVHELYDENHKLKEEVERLNNIIKELEKYFEQEGFWHSLDKIKELKGENNE